jgi:hypothetical protein
MSGDAEVEQSNVMMMKDLSRAQELPGAGYGANAAERDGLE